MKSFTISIALFFQICAFAQNITITGHASFHDASWGQLGAMEDVSTDEGGVLTFFVRNDDTNNPDSIINVRFSVSGTYYDSVYWRVWPYEIAPSGQGNNFCAVTVKSLEFPFRENDVLKIEAWSANGAYDSVSAFQNVTPELRIGNVLPNQEMNALYIYVRNSGWANCRIDKISINENEFAAGALQEMSVIGGDYVCPPGNIRILKIDFPADFTQCAPLALAVQSTRLSDNFQTWTSAGIRVVEPEFPLGTWHSSLLNPGADLDRITLRALHVNSTHGVGNPALMDTANQKYFIRAVWEPDFGDPFNPALAAAVVQAEQDADYVHVWAIDDEPDLNGKDISQQLTKNQTYWENDPNTPSYVNLAVQKKFSRYGWYSDIVGMDHYAAPNAPNILPLTWVPVVGRPGEIEEALEYTEYLKYNTEPRRMWTWCQLANPSWGQQPVDYADNYQFWAHIMGGAKGIHWFTAKPGHPGNYPEQWAEAVRLTKQFNPIKNLCLYGESANLATTTDTNAVSRTLIGPEAMVLIVVNNSINFIWNGSFNPLEYNSEIDSVLYAVEFDAPSWIQPDQIFQITEQGKTTSGFTVSDLGNRRYRITPTALYKKSHVFVIGKSDDVPPGNITGLNVAFLDSCALSWQEPFDNFGIHGYLLRYNGIAVDTIYEPVFFVDESLYSCDTALWDVIAFDAAGNLSTDTISSTAYTEINREQLEPLIYPNPATGEITIIFHVENKTINCEVTEMLGRVVFSGNIVESTTGAYHLDFSGYSKGVYFLKLQSGEKVIVKKVIKG